MCLYGQTKPVASPRAVGAGAKRGDGACAACGRVLSRGAAQDAVLGGRRFVMTVESLETGKHARRGDGAQCGERWHLGVVVDERLEALGVVASDELDEHPHTRECYLHLVVRSSVQCTGRHDVVACLRQRADGEELG